MNDMHGIILAYSPALGMREITERRTAAAVPYLSRYRVVDFVLSNMVNAGITDIGLVMRENYQSLLDHVGSGRDWGLARKLGGLRILPPFGMVKTGAREGYRGKMDALSGIFPYLKEIRQKYVVLADGDTITNLDLDIVLDHHKDTGADITAVCTPPGSLPTADSFITFGRDGFAENIVPRSSTNVASVGQQPGYCAAGYYIMSTDKLIEHIEHFASRGLFGQEQEMLKQMFGALRIAGYIHQSYIARIGSTTAYFNDSMRLLDSKTRKELFRADRPVKTKTNDSPSTYYAPDAVVHNSLIADGCHVDGIIENCILFRGVKIGRGAKLSNCIVMQDTVVGDNTRLNYVIADKNVLINAGRELVGHDSYPLVISKESVV